jgi:hypothetical protein
MRIRFEQSFEAQTILNSDMSAEVGIDTCK